MRIELHEPVDDHAAQRLGIEGNLLRAVESAGARRCRRLRSDDKERKKPAGFGHRPIWREVKTFEGARARRDHRVDDALRPRGLDRLDFNDRRQHRRVAHGLEPLGATGGLV